jgi:hypothetical protein
LVRTIGLAAGVLMLAVGPGAAPAARGAATTGPAKSAPARPPRVASVTFGIRHRVFHDFRDLQQVKMNQEFPLGDTDFTARVVEYVPDFQLDLYRRRVFSRSEQPNNPAFKVIVREGKVPQDTTWAFLKSPPHFGARSYFAFQVLRIDFAQGPPLIADSTLAAPHRPHGAAPDSAGRR